STTSLADALKENARLRLRYANLLAAARATITAAHDGDPDALAYLVDELVALHQLPPTDDIPSPMLDLYPLGDWLETYDPGSDW
ncbi:MAG: hypothetical protein ACRCY9_14805, partial [Phycicoccus sp.]